MAHINRIATAVPPHDVHQAFIGFARTLVRRPTQTALSALVRRFPGVMATVAAYTRVPDAALARTRMERL